MAGNVALKNEKTSGKTMTVGMQEIFKKISGLYVKLQ